jgi:hypothetical protein
MDETTIGNFTPPPPEKFTPLDKVPTWTICAHAADGTFPMRATRYPGKCIAIEGDVSFLIAIANELSHLTTKHPN